MATEKPVTDTKIPGTKIPDVTQAPAASEGMRKWMAHVAVTTAVLATLASISSMFASNHLNEAMIEQIRASDQWAYYQAKGVKYVVLESRLETLPALGKTVAPEDTAKLDRYKKEQEEISGEAKARQAACDDHRTRYKTMGRASTAFQIAIALSAVALLVQKNWFWVLSMLVGAVGCAFFTMGMMPHS